MRFVKIWLVIDDCCLAGVQQAFFVPSSPDDGTFLSKVNFAQTTHSAVCTYIKCTKQLNIYLKYCLNLAGEISSTRLYYQRKCQELYAEAGD